jgi:hypothetical protein
MAGAQESRQTERKIGTRRANGSKRARHSIPLAAAQEREDWIQRIFREVPDRASKISMRHGGGRPPLGMVRRFSFHPADPLPHAAHVWRDIVSVR